MMKNKVSSFLARATALALFATPICSMQAQEVYSATVGAVAIKVPSQSDLMVALPFKLEKEFGGLVDSVDSATVSFGSSVLTANAFAASGGQSGFYLYAEEGPLKGRHFDIVSNTTSTVTLSSSDLTGLSGVRVSIRAHWTLEKLFPNGVGSVSEVEPGLRDVEVIVPEMVSVGGGVAADRIFYFSPSSIGGTDAAWREVGKALATEVGSAIIPPGAAFVVRNNTASDLNYHFFGEVEFGPLAIPLVSTNGDDVDNFVSVARPLGLTINDLQLHSSSAFTASTGTDEGSRGDTLLVYSTAAGKNKAPEEYYYFNTWRKVGSDEADVGSTEIKAGQGIAVRKADSGSDGTNYWVNEWSISQ